MNRYPLRRNRYPLVFILLFSIISSYYLFNQKILRGGSGEVKYLNGNARIIEIHDGDTVTIELEGAVYRARLIGIDAPEMGQKPWGERAKRHLLKLIEKTREVRIETDIEKFDKYNRLLIYLFTGDGIFVNEQLLRDGYAVLLTIPPDIKYVDRFIKAQQEAKEHRRGIWGKEGLKEMPVEYKEKHKR